MGKTMGRGGRRRRRRRHEKLSLPLLGGPRRLGLVLYLSCLQRWTTRTMTRTMTRRRTRRRQGRTGLPV